MQYNQDTSLERRLFRTNEIGITITVLILATAGAFLQIAGSNWDVTSHIKQEPEAFSTPPHTVLYSGVGLLTVAAAIAGALLSRPQHLSSSL